MLKRILTSIIIMVFLFIAGCSKNNPVSSHGNGTLQIYMIDSPASYDQVNIVIDSVTAHSTSSDTTSGWVTLNNKAESYDLLRLVNGVNAVIGKAQIPAGSYSQLRLYIGSGSNVVIGGNTYPLITPSGSQSGVKLNINSTIQSGNTNTLTLDFNAYSSIVVTGNLLNPKYILKPVISVVASSSTGIIEGTVSPDSISTSVWAYNNSDTLSTSTDNTGGFKLENVPPATYSVKFIPGDTTAYSDTTITNILVKASSTTKLGTVVLPGK